MSDLDALHQAMQQGGEAEGLAFWRALADAELFLLLEEEAQGEQLLPKVFALEDGPVLLAFDSEDRLAAFAGTPLPYAALPGRVIAGQMAGQGLALGLNLGSGAASEVILPAAALDWLIDMLDQAPAATVLARAQAFQPPTVPAAVLAALVPALGKALAGAPGQPGRAYLAGVVYHGGARGHVLALSGAAPQDEPGLARAVTEALAFSGLAAATLDLVFLAPGDAALGPIAAVALMLEGGSRAAAPTPPPTAPGMDPDRPPILR